MTKVRVTIEYPREFKCACDDALMEFCGNCHPASDGTDTFSLKIPKLGRNPKDLDRVQTVESIIKAALHPKMYVEFTEQNDYEGEQWSFFIEATENNLDELEKLKNQANEFIATDEDLAYDLGYRLNLDPLPENVVDVMVDRSDGGYMSRYNKVKGKLTCPQFKDGEAMRDAMYKGGIKDFIE